MNMGKYMSAGAKVLHSWRQAGRLSNRRRRARLECFWFLRSPSSHAAQRSSCARFSIRAGALGRPELVFDGVESISGRPLVSSLRPA